jgi:hypothetical protein
MRWKKLAYVELLLTVYPHAQPADEREPLLAQLFHFVLSVTNALALIPDAAVEVPHLLLFLGCP